MGNINKKAITLMIPKSFQLTTTFFKQELNLLFEIMARNLTEKGLEEITEFLGNHEELNEIMKRLDKRW